MPKPKRIYRSAVAWTVLAAFFIVIGLLFHINSLGINPISDSEFISFEGDKTLPVGAVSESSLAISRYGSLGFIVVGVAFLLFAISALKED